MLLRCRFLAASTMRAGRALLSLEFVGIFGSDGRLHRGEFSAKARSNPDTPQFLRRPGSSQTCARQAPARFRKHPGDRSCPVRAFPQQRRTSWSTSCAAMLAIRGRWFGPIKTAALREKVVRDILARKISQHFRRHLHRLQRRPLLQEITRLAQPLQGTAGNKFAGVEIDAAALTGLINGKNIRVPHIGFDAGVRHEISQSPGILRELPIQRVEANLPSHIRLDRPGKPDRGRLARFLPQFDSFPNHFQRARQAAIPSRTQPASLGGGRTVFSGLPPPVARQLWGSALPARPRPLWENPAPRQLAERRRSAEEWPDHRFLTPARREALTGGSSSLGAFG